MLDLFIKHERHQPGRLVLIGLMPPLSETMERKAILSCALREVREMMDERLNLNRFLPALEIGFGPLILSERMKFANEKLTPATSKRWASEKMTDRSRTCSSTRLQTIRSTGAVLQGQAFVRSATANSTRSDCIFRLACSSIPADKSSPQTRSASWTFRVKLPFLTTVTGMSTLLPGQDRS